MKPLNVLFIATVLFGGAYFLGGYQEEAGSLISGSSLGAAVFFTQSTSSAELRTTFENVPTTKKKLNILIVPGHEPNFGGTEFRDIKERDLNADLALYLAEYLVEDGHYEVAMTRGKDGWNPHLESYFKTNDEEIKVFVRSQKEEMVRLIEEGKVTTMTVPALHNDAPKDVALRLYGINKWANERKVDVVIHIHFNDSAPRRTSQPGEYNGFTIYTPEKQYSNSQVSADISKYIFKRLSRMFPVSSLPSESEGVVESQELIAIGSSNTVDGASMLIEYGYIYEPQFKVPAVRTMVLKELAFQTYLGLADFFGETSLIVGPYESMLLPYSGKTVVKRTPLANAEILMFQAALIEKGFYPPENYSRNDCPLSGFFGSCTKRALGSFQKKFDINGERGIIGTKTQTQLRKLFEPSLLVAQ